MASNFFKLNRGLNLDPQSGYGGSDPAGVNGDIYYNSNLNVFRVFQNGAWTNLSGSVSFPITVPQGGTDLTSLSPYDILCGGTTSTGPVQQVSGEGTIGQVLTSNGPSALPTWSSTSIPFVVATGGTITTVGNFKIHTFTSSGNFVVTSSGPCRPLWIGGGGGGGAIHGAGGAGGGGFIDRLSYDFFVTPGTYPVFVGAGGAAASGSSGNDGTYGNISSFGGIVAPGGGAGAGSSGARTYYPNPYTDYPSLSALLGVIGGSGGGGGDLGGSSVAPGTGLLGYGNDGGSAAYYAGGGGGGAGQKGFNAGANHGGGGDGGNGLYSNISSSFQYYSGGGGGGYDSLFISGSNGLGGLGGGGRGSEARAGGPAVSGTVNTGGGGGGAYVGGGNGGSGIVIIAYQYM